MTPMPRGPGQQYAYPFFMARTHVQAAIAAPDDSSLYPIWTYRRRASDRELCLEEWDHAVHTSDGTEELHAPPGYVMSPWPQ